jgi:hypothetical protein
MGGCYQAGALGHFDNIEDDFVPPERVRVALVSSHNEMFFATYGSAHIKQKTIYIVWHMKLFSGQLRPANDVNPPL